MVDSEKCLRECNVVARLPELTVSRFVCAHLTAHEEKLADRIYDYNHIVGTLLFPPLHSSQRTSKSTIYDTSHLFIFGDLNFRVAIPAGHPLFDFHKGPDASKAIEPEATRESLKEFDQLLTERRKGSTFVSLREGDFWRFKCSYKYILGQTDSYRFVLLT